MLKFTYYVGLNDKDTNRQYYSRAEARALIIETLLSHGIEGATLYDAKGIWIGVSEPTIVIEVLIEDGRLQGDTIRAVAYELKQRLHQRSIMVTQDRVSVDFI